MLQLVKTGEKLNLTKDNPSLKEVVVGLGWDLSPNVNYDLDVFAWALDVNNQMVDAAYHGNLSPFNGAIKHSGDNRSGAGDGDDEHIRVKLDQIPTNVQSILFTVHIYDDEQANNRRTTSPFNFGQVRNAFVRVVDGSTYLSTTENVLLKHDLSEDFSVFQGLNVAKIYRHDGEWKYEACGGQNNGFNGMADKALSIL